MAISSWSLVRVYGTWTDHQGMLLAGNYKIKVPTRLTNSADDIIIPAGVFASGMLNTTAGVPSLSVLCPSTDDPDIQQDGWLLEVEVTFTFGLAGEKYVIEVPISNRPIEDGGNGLGINLRTIALTSQLPPQAAMYGVGTAGGLAVLSNDGTSVLDSNGDPIASSGAETITGVKTFTTSPIVPDSSFTPAKLNVSATVKSMLSAADAAGARTAIDVAAEITAARGAASGVAPLDSGSRVPDANLPTRLSDGSLHDAFAPVSQALWIPAGQFDIGEGVPTFSTINSNQSWGWMLDDATSEGGTTLLTVPGHWSQITGIEVWWCPLTAAGGNVVWAGAVYNLAHGGSLQASGSALTNLGTSTAGTTAYSVRVQASGTISLAVDPAKVQRLFVRRSGGNASDTYVGDVAFLGVKVIGS